MTSYRARLPPTRKIEVERWAVVRRSGEVWKTYATKDEADRDRLAGEIVVLLRGTATVGE